MIELFQIVAQLTAYTTIVIVLVCANIISIKVARIDFNSLLTGLPSPPIQDDTE